MVARPWTLYGPFELDKHSESSWKSIFRSEVSPHSGLTDAAGVYIIGSRLRSAIRIHYVGMTYNQGFEQEIFSQRNIPLIWDPILKRRTSAVIIWLIAKKHASRTGYSWDARLKKQAELLETLFIMHARAAGHGLVNTSKMKVALGIAVAGLFGQPAKGPKSKAIQTLTAALKLA